jgi:hypothetical protein
VDEVDAPHGVCGTGYVGKNPEATLRNFARALSHGRGLYDSPLQRRARRSGHMEIMKSTAPAEIEDRKRSFRYFGGGKAKRQDGIGSLLRRKLAGIHRKRCLIGDDVGNIAIVITGPACGKRRCKARENLGDVSQATFLILGSRGCTELSGADPAQSQNAQRLVFAVPSLQVIQQSPRILCLAGFGCEFLQVVGADPAIVEGDLFGSANELSLPMLKDAHEFGGF